MSLYGKRGHGNIAVPMGGSGSMVRGPLRECMGFHTNPRFDFRNRWKNLTVKPTVFSIAASQKHGRFDRGNFNPRGYPWGHGPPYKFLICCWYKEHVILQVYPDGAG